jgi:hypothetical protein
MKPKRLIEKDVMVDVMYDLSVLEAIKIKLWILLKSKRRIFIKNIKLTVFSLLKVMYYALIMKIIN